MEPEVYLQVKRSVKNLLDINLDHYKDQQMKRRLDAWLTRAGGGSWPAYFHRLRAEPDEMARFRNYLTINVSAFFRDPERWRDLRERVFPNLLATRRQLRVWSAGCSLGQEAYTLAILLDEVAPHRAHTLLATDLDRGALKHAQAHGPYAAQDLQHLTPGQLTKYFEPGAPPLHIARALARRLTFREHNLLADQFEGDFDLIVCRNVVIYFTDAGKMQLYQKFFDALRPGGVLFIGGTEFISQAAQLGFHNLGLSFYQKPGLAYENARRLESQR
jgi:chemotaxis protein methyltransferase CheR